MTVDSTSSFVSSDLMQTLFPMRLTGFIATHALTRVREIAGEVVAAEDESAGPRFLAGAQVAAYKPNGHLRCTLKLDPVAEIYLYDWVYRNRSLFRPEVSEYRRSYGYRIHSHSLVGVGRAANDLSSEVERLIDPYGVGREFIRFDIANFFGSIYHHDLVNWLQSVGRISGDDVRGIGRLLRHVNGRRSVGCLPAGIYPAKMLGAEFLKRLDLMGTLESEFLIRMMDDVYLIDRDVAKLERDFRRVQEELCMYSLHLNAAKTHRSWEFEGDVLSDQVRPNQAFELSEEEVDQEVEVPRSDHTSPADIDDVLKAGIMEQIEADDASDREVRSAVQQLLAVGPMDVSAYLAILPRFPSLAKLLHTAASWVQDKEGLLKGILLLTEENRDLTEYTLFWMTWTAELHLSGVPGYERLLDAIYRAPHATAIVQARVMEASGSAGLAEPRKRVLMHGGSSWPAWCAALGLRHLNPSERNLAYSNFSTHSDYNLLVVSAVLASGGS